MYLHEFQAKEILKSKKIIVPKSILIDKIKQIELIKNELKSEKIVIKAQIHSGARGKFGGIKIINNEKKIYENEIKNLLYSKLITNQTEKKGKPVNHILIEEFIKTEHEFYISFYINRITEKLILTVSKFGGKEIEENKNSDFLNLEIDIDYGIEIFHIRNILFFLNINYIHFENLKILIKNLFKIFKENDLILLEINPLIIYGGEFYCLDAKFEVDDNSFYRNKKLFEQYDFNQDTEIENKAKKINLNYISLHGNIGCIVNGAGLAMATLDLLKINELDAANFLDIGGNANEETIENAIEIINLEKNLNGIFINIFGGIIKCNIIAEILIKKVKEKKYKIPIIMRLAGNMSKEGISMIKDSKLNIYAETNLKIAIKKLIEKVKEIK